MTQGAADLALILAHSIPQADATADIAEAVKEFLAFVKTTLGDAVAEVRASERLTDSAVCLVAPIPGPDRASRRFLQALGG